MKQSSVLKKDRITHVIPILLGCFVVSSVAVPSRSFAKEILVLPQTGLSKPVTVSLPAARLKGIRIDRSNPMELGFIVDAGKEIKSDAILKEEVGRLSKYFLTCLTVPGDELWVNLSPYEKNRIMPERFSMTEMGKDLLELDYELKQFVSSLTYPESELGKKFWANVYLAAQKELGTTRIPTIAYNKVWIMPDSAKVLVTNQGAFIQESHLAVRMQADLLSHEKNNPLYKQGSEIFNSVFEEMIIPQILKEINTGEKFARVRQIYDAMVMATWYKNHMNDSLIAQGYVGKNMIVGIKSTKEGLREEIYKQYLMAFKRSAYNYVKEEYDPQTKMMIARKYVSGGLSFNFKNPTDYTEIAVQSIGVDQTGNIDNPLMAKVTLLPEQRGLSSPFGAIKKLVKPLVMAVVMAVTGLASMPMLAQGATYQVTNQGRIEITIERGDTAGKIVEQLSRQFKKQKLSQPDYLQGNMWGKGGKVDKTFGGQAVEDINPGQKFLVGNNVPAQLFTGAAKSASSVNESSTQKLAVKAVGDSVAPFVISAQPLDVVLPKFENPISKQASSVEVVKEMRVSELQIKPAFNPNEDVKKMASLLGELNIADTNSVKQINTGSYVTSAPSQQIDGLLPLMSVLLTLVVCFGVNSKIDIETKKLSMRYSAQRSIKQQPSGSAPGDPPDPLLNRIEVKTADLALPVTYSEAAPASTQEGSALADDLAKMQRLNKEPDQFLLPEMNEDVERPENGLYVRNFMRIMDGLSLLTGWAILNPSLDITSPQGWAAISIPFIFRGMFAFLVWLEELGHSIGAATSVSEWWGSRNLLANVTFGSWLRVMIPGTALNERFSPFVHVTSDPYRNQKARLTGFILASLVGIGLSVGVFILSPWVGVPVVLAAIIVIVASFWSDILQSQEAMVEGLARCGIIGLLKRIDSRGIDSKDVQKWSNWLSHSTDALTDRGGQSAGISTLFTNEKGQQELLLEKRLKNKRGLSKEGFHRNMIHDLFDRFNANLPAFLKPIDTHGRQHVLGLYGHVRFGTAGDLLQESSHPHVSRMERKPVWVIDTTKGLVKKMANFVAVVAHNGDFDAIDLSASLKNKEPEKYVDFGQMRKILPALTHFYYAGRINVNYLKSKVNNGKDKNLKQAVPTNYRKILKALRAKGYVTKSGHVSEDFKGLDNEFKKMFDGYAGKTFAEIESALYGLPPGDSPLIPIAMDLLMTQGRMDASVRKAHVLLNHSNQDELLTHMMTKDETTALGDVFNGVFAKVARYLERAAYDPSDKDQYKTLSDLYVKDEVSARRLGLLAQYEMLTIFKSMIIKQMERLIQSEDKSLNDRERAAKSVVTKMEAKWMRDGYDVQEMRLRYVDLVVESFLTSGRLAATKEFKERFDGTAAIFVRSSIEDDGLSLMSQDQDVVIGRNNTDGVITFASDPRVLRKHTKDNKEIAEELIVLENGQVMDVGFAMGSGRIITNLWSNENSRWHQIQAQEVNERFFPTAEIINGQNNPYYTPPPHEYENPREMLKEDLRLMTQVLEQARDRYTDEQYFNNLTTQNLAQRIIDIRAEKLQRRSPSVVKLKIISYGNSLDMSRQFKRQLQNLMDLAKGGLQVDVIDANKFDKDPRSYITEEDRDDTIVMVVSKSGATFPSKLAVMLARRMINPDHLFVFTARMDSVLNTIIKQGLRPEDEFKRQTFTMGQFYPSEAPVLSEVLLMFHLTAIAFKLSGHLQSLTEIPNSFAGKFTPDRTEELYRIVAEDIISKSKEATGFDADQQPFKSAWGDEIRSTGRYLGNVLMEPFMVNRIMEGVIWSVFAVGAPLSLYFDHSLTWATLDFIVFKYLATHAFSRFYRWKIGRPLNGRISPPKVFILGDDIFHPSQQNYYSRLFSNGLSTTSPSTFKGGNPEKDFVTKRGHEVVRGDLLINFIPAHRLSKTQMSITQVTLPNTGAVFGTKFLKGRAEVRHVVAEIPTSKISEETDLLESTAGFVDLLIASKVIGVSAGYIASLDGRLWKIHETYSRAGVHTTPTPISVNNKARAVLQEKGIESVRDLQHQEVEQLHPNLVKVSANDDGKHVVEDVGVRTQRVKLERKNQVSDDVDEFEPSDPDMDEMRRYARQAIEGDRSMIANTKGQTDQGGINMSSQFLDLQEINVHALPPDAAGQNYKNIKTWAGMRPQVQSIVPLSDKALMSVL